MSSIRRISLQIITASDDGAGTDGWVYLGLAGREFNVKSGDASVNDFERGSNRTYIFGEGANVRNPNGNDPRSPLQLDNLIDMRFTPTYVRLEPVGDNADWHVGFVRLAVDVENGNFTMTRLDGNESLWLGNQFGKYLHFRR